VSERPLVFLHIPKTAGISVSYTLMVAEGPPRVLFGFDRAFFGPFRDFGSVPAENRAFIHLSPDTIPRDEKLVRAHMALSTLRAAYPGARFMTVLREPICRLLSHYLFWRGFTEQQDKDWGGWAAYSGLARGRLEDFLADGRIACQIDNVATRLLLWPHDLIPEAGMIEARHDAALIDQARIRLCGLDFVDAVENPFFDANLAAWLGAPPARVRMNETPPLARAMRTRLDLELSLRAQGLLAARSRLDLALWQWVLRERAPGVDAAALRLNAVLNGTARTAVLLAGMEEG
jgi:hypothetical protein